MKRGLHTTRNMCRWKLVLLDIVVYMVVLAAGFALGLLVSSVWMGAPK